MTAASNAIPAALEKAEFPTDVVEVVQTLKRAGYHAFVVGGSIRDLLLGKNAKDYDVATSARAERVARLFKRVIPTGIKHGTVTVLTRTQNIEVTTFRGEGEYHDGRRPSEVFFHEDVVEDLARRDFTINAMAFDPVERRFVDPFGGTADLAARTVRCVGDPRKRFGEDGLRALRAVRFASVLDFEIDAATREAIPETLDTFAKVAAERVREELHRLLLGPHPGRGLRLLSETGLLPHTIPELLPLLALPGPGGRSRFAITQARLDAIPADNELRLAALFLDLGRSLGGEQGDDTDSDSNRIAAGRVQDALERLRYPRRLCESVAVLVREQAFARRTYETDAAMRRAIVAAGGAAAIPKLAALQRAEAIATEAPELALTAGEVEAHARRVLAENPPLTPGELAIGGKEIMDAIGKGPGPYVGDAMRHLLDCVLEDPSLNDPDKLLEILREWAADATIPQAQGGGADG